MSGIRYRAKANGLAILKGRWISAWLILVFISLLTYGITALENGYRQAFDVSLDWQAISAMQQKLTPTTFIITAVAALVTILLVSPLKLGKAEWYWNLSDNRPEGVSAIFAWFSSFRLYGKSVLLLLSLAARVLLWYLLIGSVPTAMIFGAYYMEITYKSNSMVLAAAMISMSGALLMMGALFLLMFVISRYFLAAYLFVEDNTRKINEVIRESVRLTKGYRMEIVKFVLSFIVWFIIGAVTLVGQLFVDPYYSASSVVFARHIIFTRRAALRGPQGAAEGEAEKPADESTIEFDAKQ